MQGAERPALEGRCRPGTPPEPAGLAVFLFIATFSL